MSKALLLVLLLPLLLFGLALSGVSLWLAFSFFPAGVVWAALVLLAALGAFFIFRRRTGAVAGSESAFLRQSSKDGLL